jgi:HAD superfamily hydrolase (TIGR01509 family)
MNGPPIRFVSLDIGGTVAELGTGPITARLADVLECDFRAVRAVVQPLKTRRGSPRAFAAAVCAATDRPDRIPAATAVLEQAHRDTSVIRPYRDVRPALAELRARGLGIVLFSNVIGSAAPPAGSAPPLDDAVDAVFYSCDLGFAKPDPCAFREVARRLTAEPSEILHIGDAEDTDVAGARAAGWRALLLARSADGDGPGWIRSLASLPECLPRDRLDATRQRGAPHAS